MCATTVAALFLCSAGVQAETDRIPFNGQQLFLSGANVAWVDFAADIGPGATAFETFANMFQQLHDNQGNSMRLWLHTDGAHTPEFDGSLVTGPGEGAVADLAQILDLAWEREVGLVLSLWSFDMLRQSNGHVMTDFFNDTATTEIYTQAYIDNALIPLVDALKDHPAIIAWEIFNEPEGMSNEHGWGFNLHVPMADIQRFINLCAGAIHRADPGALVTNGSWSFISQTDVPTAAAASAADMSPARIVDIERSFFRKYGVFQRAEEILQPTLGSGGNYNYYTDARLIEAGGDPDGTLDIYNVHYYDWAGTPLSPFHNPYAFWNLDKPLAVTEFFMQDTFGVAYDALYGALYDGGYAGAMGWQWFDGEPHWSRMLASMEQMWIDHPTDVDIVPQADGTGPGAVPSAIEVERLSTTRIRIRWLPSTCDAAQDYAIYEGIIGSWYGHQLVACTDADPLLEEDVDTSSGDRYYLVVPLSANAEGSYGTDSGGTERPAGGSRCLDIQAIACR
jgi:hypothetical protein